MSGDDDDRRLIRDAMDRLLAGTPIRSDGKLTVKSLAVEAGVKRWVLTHKLPDLQDEFRDRVRTHGTTPDAMRSAVERAEELDQRLATAQAALRSAEAEVQSYARIIQVLALENEQLKLELASSPSNITALVGNPVRSRGARPAGSAPGRHSELPQRGGRPGGT